MSIKILIFILYSIVITGCANIKSLENVTTTIKDSEDKLIYQIECKDDALVEFKQGDNSFKVDNRDQPGFFRSYMEYMLIRAAPTVELSNQPNTSNN